MAKYTVPSNVLTPVIGILSDPEYNQGAVDAIALVQRKDVEVETLILDFGEISIASSDLALPVDVLEKKYFSDFDSLAKKQLETVNGLFLPGDEFDVPPELYGQEKHRETDINPDPRRTLLVRALIRNAQEFSIMPSLGICGSLQQYTALRGGELVQHLPDYTDGSINHSQAGTKYESTAHTMRVSRFTDKVDTFKKPVASTLYRILQSKEEREVDPEGQQPCVIKINSIHHQAADGKKTMDSVAVTATAPDGTVEALEPVHNLPFIAVQFHPELVRRMDSKGEYTLTNAEYRRNRDGDGKDYDLEGNLLPADPAYEANQRILEDLVDKSAAHYAKQQMNKALQKKRSSTQPETFTPSWVSKIEREEAILKQSNTPLGESLIRGFVGA